MCPSLPTELWFETFAVLPRRTLLSLHSTSQLFHGISRPLLFGDFDFHPFQIQEGANSRYSNQNDVDRSIRRLEFWTSSPIAPFVRACTFSAFCRSRDDPSPVFAAFFRLLPNLSSLQQLNCVIIKFDRVAVEALCALPNLTRVQLTGCSLDEEVTGLLLRVKSFFYVHIAGTRSSGAHRWLSILDKGILYDLKLPSAPSPSLFLEGETSDLPNVHTLLLGIKDWSEIPLLSKFPAVRSLQVPWCPSFSGEVGRRPILFAYLDEYDGPHEMLLFLDPRAAPTRLNIVPCDPQLLLERFFTARVALRAVEQLLISLYFLQQDVLGGCLTFLPNLRELRVKVCQPFDNMEIPDAETHTRQTFYDSIVTSSPFPSTLEKLYISWPAYSDPHTPFTLASAQAVRNALQSANTALRCIWLATPEFQYLWIRHTNTEFTRMESISGRRDARIRLAFAFPDLQDPFVLRYSNA
ncbi:hypothetical protein B0H19DRAFT_1258068 [Mycena capillaripes]|nr:hypothetical protein B0H19DRAFT_1258068 [Mycena capillaripes]